MRRPLRADRCPAASPSRSLPLHPPLHLPASFWRGLTLGSLPGLVLVVWALTANPWFADWPVRLALLAGVAPGLLVAALWRRPAHPAWPVAAGAAALAWGAVGFWPEPEPDRPRVLVIVWDGATWTMIDRLTAQGELLATRDLMDTGMRADLMSMEPMFSPLLWTTMATGKPPAQHGVRGFHTRSSDVVVPRFWDIAESQGMSVGVYKWLVTYPPRALRGFMVPDWLAPAPETWPPELGFVKELELQNRLKRKRMAGGRPTWRLVLEGVPRGLRFSTLARAGLWKLREAALRPGPQERTIALQLLRGWIDRDVFVWALHQHQPDLATFGYYATDALGHPFWSDLGPEDPGAPPTADALPAAYRQADAILLELRRRVWADCALIVLSDHGFRAADPTTDRMQVMPLTERLRARLAEQGLPVDIARLGWKLTVTFDPAQAEPVAAALAALHDEQGRPFYTVEPTSEGALGLSLADEALSEARLATGTVGGEPITAYVQAGEPFAGEHDARGIFLAQVPGQPARALQPLTLLDIAPTVQALLGIPPAQDLPGRVILGPPRRGPASRDALARELRVLDGVEGVDEEALRALGYVE